ncbi:MAG: hypothetical protein Ct9H300mP14_06310 [Gammaproteobacteria bacterium]|nr:MAG: hypothetical protein Ct9H300mP14_06310 [Gammaproteobacteria bacterium]
MSAGSHTPHAPGINLVHQSDRKPPTTHRSESLRVNTLSQNSSTDDVTPVIKQADEVMMSNTTLTGILGIYPSRPVIMIINPKMR